MSSILKSPDKEPIPESDAVEKPIENKQMELEEDVLPPAMDSDTESEEAVSISPQPSHHVERTTQPLSPTNETNAVNRDVTQQDRVERQSRRKRGRLEKTPATVQHRNVSRKTPRRMHASKTVQMARGHKSIKTTLPAKKKRRFRPGTVALRDIRRYQRTTNLLIPRAPFHKLAQEVLSRQNPSLRFSRDGRNAIQEAAEAFLVEKFKLAQILAIHRHREIIKLPDFLLAKHLKPETSK